MADTSNHRSHFQVARIWAALSRRSNSRRKPLASVTFPPIFSAAHFLKKLDPWTPAQALTYSDCRYCEIAGMADRTSDAVLQGLCKLVESQATQLSDGQLLNRFASDRDEVAFAVLLQRY